MRRKTKPKIASLFKATSPDRVRHAEVLSLHSQISITIIFKQKPFIFKVVPDSPAYVQKVTIF